MNYIRMKLVLKNFRCYESKEIDFGPDGMVLLSGPSGNGKTSLLMAINFALYGIGAKVTMSGKTSCSVEFHFRDMIITRTKRPNRLVLKRGNIEIEDDGAQGIIDKYFGKHFDIVSYVQQNTVKSFVMMGPSDKLAFLEKIAFDGIDISKIKYKVAGLIKKYDQHLLQTASQLQLSHDHLQTLSKPDDIPYPIAGKKNIAKSIEREQQVNQNCLKRIDKYKLALGKMTEQKYQWELQQNKIDNYIQQQTELKKEVQSVYSDLDNILQVVDNYAIDDLRATLQVLTTHSKLINMKQDLAQQQGDLAQAKQDEESQRKNKIAEYQQALWTTEERDEQEQLLASLKDTLQDAITYHRLEKQYQTVDKGRLNELTELMANLESKLEEQQKLEQQLELAQNTYECPQCNALLKFEQDELIAVDSDLPICLDSLNDIINQIRLTKSQLKKYQLEYKDIELTLAENDNITEQKNALIEQYQDWDEEVFTISVIKADIRDVEEYIASNKEMETELSKLTVQRYSNTILNWDKRLTKQAETIQAMEEQLPKQIPTTDIDKIRDEISYYEQTAALLPVQKANLQNLTNKLKKLTDELDECNQVRQEQFGQFDYEQLLDKIEKARQGLANDETKLIEHNELMKNIELYQQNQIKVNEYQQWVDKIETLQGQENEYKSKLATATTLKEKIIQAESIAIINIIDSINTHAQTFLDIFFPTEPMTILLQPFKETAKKQVKPQVNMYIEYKGMTSDLSMLSGGELSRVVLAYTLALAELYNSPLILLDECTASLDQELTGIVIDGIKENFPERMIVVIAHQVVAGIFDQVMNI